jgi:hypothetical protein
VDINQRQNSQDKSTTISLELFKVLFLSDLALGISTGLIIKTTQIKSKNKPTEN